MKVSELIKVLQGYNKDLEVVCETQHPHVKHFTFTDSINETYETGYTEGETNYVCLKCHKV